MLKKDNIRNYVDNEMLESICMEREGSIYTYSQIDIKELEKIYAEYSIDYDRLLSAVNNLPPHFGNIRENIVKKLACYSDREKAIGIYENRKFYKTGFCDGAKMMLEILNNK